MKKLLLTMVLLIGMIGVGNATIVCTADTSDAGPGHTYVDIVIDTTDGNPPDSAVRQYTLLFAKSNPPTTRQDSITGSHTFPDTISVTALDNGVQYYYRVEYVDSVTTDTTAVDSFTTDDLTQTLTVYDTTASQVGIENNTANTDSGLTKLVLLWGTYNDMDSLAHQDSITSSITDPDSLVLTDLAHNTTYYYAWLAHDSAFTDTSAIGTILTEGIELTIYPYDTTYRHLYFRIEEANADSALKKLVLEVLRRGSVTTEAAADTVYTRIDSATSINNNDDSLNTAQGTFELATALDAATDKYVLYRFIATDSTDTDSTAVDSIMLDKYNWYNYFSPTGKVGGVYHDRWSWDESQDSWTSGRYKMSEGIGARIWMKVFGEDNNHTFDSLYVITYSYTPAGDKNAVDTVIIAEMDTGTHVAEYIWLPIIEDTVWQVRNGPEDWGTEFGFDANVTDSSASVGDTMDLDIRYLDVWVEILKNQ